MKQPNARTAIALILCFAIGFALTFTLSAQGMFPAGKSTSLAPVHAIDAPPAATAQSPSALDLLNEGIQHFQAQRFTDAIASWQDALNAYTDDSNGRQRALVLSNLSLAYQHTGQWQAAKDSLGESLAFFEQQTAEARSATDWEYYAKALNARGWYLWRRGQPELSLDAWQQATQAYGAASYFPGIVGSQINRAKAQQSLGLSVAAQETLELVWENAQQQNNPQLRITALQALGNAWRRVGDLNKSQKVLEQSLAIAKQDSAAFSSLDQRNAVVSSVLLDLGNTERAQWGRSTALSLNDVNARYTNALKHYQDAAAIAPSVLSKTRAIANQLSLLVESQTLESNESLAPDIEQEIWRLWDALQPELAKLPLGRSSIALQVHSVDSLLRLWASQAAQDVQTSETRLELASVLAQSLQQARQLGDVRSQSLAYGELGHLYEQAGQWHDAKQVTEQAIALSESIQASDIQYRWEWQLGRILKAQNDATTAIQAYSQAVKSLEEVRSDLLFIDSDIQFSFRDDVEPVYRDLVKLLLKEPTPSQDALAAAVGHIDTLQLAELENFLDCDLSSTVELSQADIGSKAALLYTIIVDNRLEVVLKLPNQADILHHSAAPEKDINQTLDTLRYNLEQDYITSAAKEAASELYRWIIEPQEEALAASGIDTLVFVLDGALRNVPMTVLQDENQQYLIEQYAIALAPRLQLQTPEALDPNSLEALFFGLSDIPSQFRSRFTPLPFVEAEAESLAKSSIPNQLRLNDAFTNARLQQDVQDNPFTVIHFATHGEFSSDPENTFLLAWDKQVTSGDLQRLLQSREEVNAIDLLVLSACKTADGDDRATLGLAGIAFQAGAESVVASLWVINDEATATFMDAFYRALTSDVESMSRAKALQQAQLTLLNDGYVPYYWAPFVLVGNWL